jgi:hypothetical protein
MAFAEDERDTGTRTEVTGGMKAAAGLADTKDE